MEFLWQTAHFILRRPGYFLLSSSLSLNSSNLPSCAACSTGFWTLIMPFFLSLKMGVSK